MSARSVLEAWSRETVQHAAFASVSGYGERTYAAPVARAARIDHASKLIRDQRGEQRVSSTQLYLAMDAAVNVLDRWTLPDGTTPLPLRVDRLADYQGAAWLVIVYF